MARTTKCRDCGLEVMFLHTRDGKRMPVDPYPHEDGTVAARPHAGAYVDGHVIKAGQLPGPGYRRFLPHFATCQARRRAREQRPRPVPAPTLFGGESS